MKTAVDAKGQNFVMVSYVKGHAKEIYIAMGLASWKEAEAKQEADKQAVKGDKEHEIPELVVEN